MTRSSFFTRARGRGTDPSNPDADGIITVNELFAYLSHTVPKASGQVQHPVKKGEMEGELVIGRAR